MIKHATVGAFAFCDFPDGWRLGLIEHLPMGVMACPGGHVEDDESQAQAAIREVEEETGLRGVRLFEPPAPALSAGFPATHSRVALPWWITEMRVPADNHLADNHVHIDHAWVGIAPDPHPADQPAHPFGWYTAEETQELPMFEDARLLAKVLFTCVADLVAGNLAGAGILAPFATVAR
jgi:8-oxo-dGTP pyrophosphatase MutT (NUDIX family)